MELDLKHGYWGNNSRNPERDHPHGDPALEGENPWAITMGVDK